MSAGRAGLIAALAACSGSSSPADEGLACVDDVEAVAPLPGGIDPNAIGREAGIEVEENHAGSAVTGRYRLLFFDTSVFDGDPAPTEPEGLACVRVIGQAVIRRAADGLSMGQVEIGGLAWGTESVASVPSGLHVSGPIDGVVFGDADVSVAALSDTDADSTFPGFELSAPAAAPLRSVDIEAIPNFLEIEWSAGSADLVEIVLTTTDEGPPELTNRIVCHVVDDGCHRISSSSVAWLLTAGNLATVQLQRVEQVTEAVADDALATLRTMQTTEVQVDLETGLVQ